jgi:hypothetical protein
LKHATIFLAAFLIMQIFSSCDRAEPEIYLIPYNFQGEVNIIFNQDGIAQKYKNEYNRDSIYMPKIGAAKKYENRYRVYEIPSSGILLTQFKANSGWHIDRKYFYVDSLGNRFPLKIFEFKHFKQDSAGYVIQDKNLKGIFGDGTNGSLGNINIPFQNFTICSYNQLPNFSTKEYLNRIKDTVQEITNY